MNRYEEAADRLRHAALDYADAVRPQPKAGKTTFTNDVVPGNIVALLERLRQCDGVASDCLVLTKRHCQVLTALFGQWLQALTAVARDPVIAQDPSEMRRIALAALGEGGGG